MLRIAASAMVVIATAAAIRYACLEPFERNARALRLQKRTLDALGSSNRFEAVRIARENLDQLEAPGSEWNLDLLMIRAVNYRIVDNGAAAAATYQQALKLDRRPEIYFNLGDTLLSTGDLDGSASAFVRACRFDRRLLRDVVSRRMRERVEAQLAAN